MSEPVIFYSGPIVTRAEALALGLKHYFTGKPCINGHIHKRSIRRVCLACSIKYSNEFREKNPMYSRQCIAEYRKKNPNYDKQSEKKRWEKNPSGRYAKTKAHQIKNKEMWATYARNRRAKLKMSEGSHTKDDVLAIGLSQKWQCVCCKVCIKNTYTVDHIIPLALGGNNGPKNLQLLCKHCNSSKNKKHPIDWALENGRLV